MANNLNRILAAVLGLMLGSNLSPGFAVEGAPAASTRFLVVGKSLLGHPGQQKIGEAAVRKIAEAAGKACPRAAVDALAENVMTMEQYRSGQLKEQVTGTIFRERLRQLAVATTADDTVVIYTHSHGRRDGFEPVQPLGGIVLDLPVRRPEHRGTFLWDEYADLLLKIPARNLVVLTMACFSGGLVDYLNSAPVHDLWIARRPSQGRNLIVLTSQSRDLLSNPIIKDGETINPFTYAVAQALAGMADGVILTEGNLVAGHKRDGQLTVGEFTDFVLHKTRSVVSELPRLKNTAQPQLAGSFSRDDVLFSVR